MINLSRERIYFWGSTALLMLGLTAVAVNEDTSVAHAALNVLNNRAVIAQNEPPTATPIPDTPTPQPGIPTATQEVNDTPQAPEATATQQPPEATATQQTPEGTSTPDLNPTATSQPGGNDPTPTTQPIGFLSGRAMDENGLGIQGASIVVEEPNGTVVTNKTNRWGEYNEHDLTGNGVYTMTIGPVVDEQNNVVQELTDTQYVVEPTGNTQVADVTITADNPLGSELTLSVVDPDTVTAANTFGTQPIVTKAGKDRDGDLYTTVFQGDEKSKVGYEGVKVSGIDGRLKLSVDSGNFAAISVEGTDTDGVNVTVGEGTRAITVETQSMVAGVTYDINANINSSAATIAQHNVDGTTTTTDLNDTDGDGVIQQDEQQEAQGTLIYIPFVVNP